MIEFVNVSKIYTIGKNDFYALRDVDLHIAKEDFVAIKGVSGSGKTTLLNIIGCIDTLSNGKYLLNGEDVSAFSDEKRANIRNTKIGFVLQDFALLNDQTVFYNVMLPLLLGKMPYRKIRKAVSDTLTLIGIADIAKKKVNQLSGGQRQRVAIARAVVTDPDIILADEPTGQLDSQTSSHIMEILKAQNERGITVIVVTHDDAVADYAKRILTVTDGQIQEQ